MFDTGDEPFFDDGKGHTVMPDVLLAVCDKAGEFCRAMGRPDLFVTESNYYYGDVG